MQFTCELGNEHPPLSSGASFHHQFKPLIADNNNGADGYQYYTQQLSLPSQQSSKTNQPSFSQHSSSPRINPESFVTLHNEIPLASDMNKKALSILFANQTRPSHNTDSLHFGNNNNNIVSSSTFFRGDGSRSHLGSLASFEFGFKPTPHHDYHDSANHHSKDWFSLNSGPINSNFPYSIQQHGFPSQYHHFPPLSTTKSAPSSSSMMTPRLPSLIELEPHRAEPTTTTTSFSSSSHTRLINNFEINPPPHSTILHSKVPYSSSAFTAYNSAPDQSATLLSKRNSLQSFKEVVDFIDEKKKRPKDHQNESKSNHQQVETKKRKLEENGKKDLFEDDDDEGCGEDEENGVDEDFVNSSEKLLPIRSLAHLVGLSKDEGKTWRYRDVRRALFEKTPKEHTKFIESNQQHAILRQRLPHKLTLVSFCKRIMLLVFHFIIRDGREPKFFTRSHVKRDLIEETLEKEASEFFKRINRDVAMKIHALSCTGMSLEQASKTVSCCTHSENVIALSKDHGEPSSSTPTLASCSSSSPHLNHVEQKDSSFSLPSLRDLLKKPHK
ncbi:hypothetical protein C9374_009663 [Naegleria lovaniensis]|uniref:Uncharacterized protein n=1 Tax=Naegleria lovaniensis TaxID=51637 RepID=A0AA88H5C4_NAELO|nr:uncharacterized protein C9374_009663 [Naegleria lovaniensis]KAG2393086.1 hypothetical protein C9374_009663 [Naegleria lovaniensis]